MVDLVKATVEAYNRGDIGYFDKLLADDVLWVDEDGHEMTTKMFALYLLRSGHEAVHDSYGGGDTRLLRAMSASDRTVPGRSPRKRGSVVGAVEHESGCADL
jgi:ketosteroid isomerase-like protein